MMRTLISIVIAALLSGCITPDRRHFDAGPTPTCSGEADCAVKWAAARSFVLAHAGMKIQTYSPDFLQTYGSTDMSVAAQVNKQPVAGGFAIVARFACGNMFGCDENPEQLLAEFNSQVAAARP